MDTHRRKLFFFKTSGYSMWPFLRPGQKLLVKACSWDSVRIGDVLAYHKSGVVVCHRLVGRNVAGQELLVRGDSSYGQPERIPARLVIGRVISVNRAWSLVVLIIAPLCARMIYLLNPLYKRLRRKKQ